MSLGTVISLYLVSHFTNNKQNLWRKFLSGSENAICSSLLKYQEIYVQIQTFTEENCNIRRSCYFLHSCIICLCYFNHSQMNGGRVAFDVEVHKNGRRKQINYEIKKERSLNLARDWEIRKKLALVTRIFPIKKISQGYPGGCKQLKLHEA